MATPCTETPARAWAHGAGPLPVVGSRDGHAHSSRGDVGGEHLFHASMTTTHPEFEDTCTLAEWVGLKLVRQNDARNGRFRLLNGSRIVSHSDDLRELQQFALAWRYVR